MEKKTAHQIDKTDVEITIFELERIMGESFEHLQQFCENIFCFECREKEDIKLTNYKIYLTKLNDIVLRGDCSGCNQIAARYLETGESPAKSSIAKEIRQQRKSLKSK
jgi:hypothetical protein